MDVGNKSPVLGSLKFLTGPLAGSTLPITKPVMTIGRDETSNDIVISDPSVSRHHARIILKGAQWTIEKLAPQNTVSVNSRDVQQAPLADRDTIALGTGTTVLFQMAVSAAQPVSYAAPPVAQQQAMSYAPPVGVPSPGWTPGQQQSIPYAPSTPPISAAPSPSLPTPQAPLFISTEPAEGGTQRVQPGSLVGMPGDIPSIEVSSNVHAEKQIFPLNKPTINIGRESSNDIVINELVVSG
ncbi:MAG TPA: FHA domain-containing protein, partial [Ktedonobacteraceae bacterium]|nr:FHA domain-containing protein [Ktedonobacteraceae bacterium]